MLAMCRKPLLRDPELPPAFPIRNAPCPKDVQDAVSFPRADLVVLQSLISEMTLDSLPELLVMVGELIGIPAWCR